MMQDGRYLRKGPVEAGLEMVTVAISYCWPRSTDHHGFVVFSVHARESRSPSTVSRPLVKYVLCWVTGLPSAKFSATSCAFTAVRYVIVTPQSTMGYTSVASAFR